MRLEKLRPAHVNATIVEDIGKILDDFKFLKDYGIKCIWLDEVNFTKKTFQSMEYS